jgi:hypothetical protein
MQFPLSVVKGDSDVVAVAFYVPKALRDSLKYKAINEATTLQAIGYTALLGAALNQPPPLPSARCQEAIVNYRDEIKATYPEGSEIRKKLLGLSRQMVELITEDAKIIGKS